ncbi:MAG: hypothetical protein C0604_01165 [Clostridiales bacterium]|nr:MAG: hypothetical protein C0604_01165 [Clostridiales bacterium]
MAESLKHMQKIDTGDHLVLLYKDENIENMVASFIKASLDRNERCMYVKGDTDTEKMLVKLSHLVDSKKAIEEGSLFIMDRSEAYSKDGLFMPDKMVALLQSEAKNAVIDGYSGLSVTGELSWVLDYEDGRERIIEYEWKLNDRVFDDYPVTALCRYNMNRFNPSMIKSIIELHPFIIYDGKINENPYYVEPEAYRDNKIEEYEVKSWLKNINNLTNTRSKFINDIEKKESEYQDLFHRIKDAISISELYETQKKLTLKNANKASEDLSGYTLDELKGASISDFDNKEGLYEWASSVPDGFESTFETEIIRKDGEKRSVEINAKLYEESGKKYVLSVARDISMKKRYVEDILATVTNFLEIHDNYTKGHSEKVAALAKETARAMGLPSEKVNETYLTGLVHDIGKMLIPENILNKPGELSKEEYGKIKKHPEWAYEAIIKNEALSEIAKNAKHHHERWDGKGYPDGLKGNEIPIVSQILTVADSYDAMTSERAYRSAMTKNEAVAELKACKGTQFPPHVVDVFIEKVLKLNF